MLYLLDANVLIDADRDYYPIDRVPEFWGWLLHNGDAGNIAICVEVYEEVIDATGQLPDWLKKDLAKNALLFDGESEPVLVSKVVAEGYAPDLTDIEIVELGRDPFLIAHALALPGDRCVVTTESSKPSKKRQNRRVPDVCAQFGVPCCDTFSLLRSLDFRTDWKP